MRFFLGVAAVLSSAFAHTALADVSIRLEDGTQVIAVNGNLLQGDDMPGVSRTLRLEDGKNQLVVEHDVQLKDSADEFVLDTSKTHVLLFSAEDARLSLRTPAIDSRHEMQAFNHASQWRLVDEESREIPYRSGVMDKQGLQFGRDYAAELKRFNRSNSPAALPRLAGGARLADDSGAMPAAANGSAVPAAMPSGDMTDQAMVWKMLKFWYQQASSTTRRDFKNWLEEGQ